MPFLRSRLASGFALLLGLAGSVLAILTVFAGSSPTFFPTVDMVSFNISQIGKTPQFGTTNLSQCKRDIDERGIPANRGNTINNAAPQAQTLAGCAGQKAQDLTVATKLSQGSSLPGFIDLHVLNFCAGQFDPTDYVAQGIKNPQRKRFFCSMMNINFSFSLTRIIQDNLPSGVSLQDIKWPQDIPKAEDMIRPATQTMIYMYLVGIGGSALTAFISVLGLLTTSRVIASVGLLFSSMSFFAFLISSAVGTAIVFKAVSTINQFGNDIGIAASRGYIYLGMTWAATSVMLIAVITLVAQIIARRKTKVPKNYHPGKYGAF